jgi:hypothetical protein
MKHPALQMSKARREVWLKQATPVDYFDMITLLSQLYVKKTYDPGKGVKPNALFVDYQAHQEAKHKTIKESI